jgi:hypothetical protein
MEPDATNGAIDHLDRRRRRLSWGNDCTGPWSTKRLANPGPAPVRFFSPSHTKRNDAFQTMDNVVMVGWFPIMASA